MNVIENNTIFDTTQFPVVKIIFGKSINSEKEFEEIKRLWMMQYTRKQNFYIVFNTEKLDSLNVSYIYNLAKFIKELKKLSNEDQYLKVSIIYIKSFFVNSLLKLYLKISNPLSKVYIVNKSNDIDIICNKLINGEKVEGYTEYN